MTLKEKIINCVERDNLLIARLLLDRLIEEKRA